MARNRYGWEKRAKEMARKQKSAEKLQRRRSKDKARPEEGSAPGTGEEQELAPESGEGDFSG